MGNGARWYGRNVCRDQGEKRAPIQSHRWERDQKPALPDELVRLASAEYNRQGYGQSHERLCERGGLSDMEIICLLADALEHERAHRRQRGLSTEKVGGGEGKGAEATLGEVPLGPLRLAPPHRGRAS